MLDYKDICKTLLNEKLIRKITNSNVFDIRKTVKDIQDYYLAKSKPTILHVVGSSVFSGLEKVAFGTRHVETSCINLEVESPAACS